MGSGARVTRNGNDPPATFHPRHRYCVGFSVFLVLVAAVLTLEKGHNFKKIGGQTILWCIPILLLAPCVVWLGVSAAPEPVYLSTMLLCIGWMVYRFKAIAYEQAVKFNHVELTTDDDVINWFDPTFLAATPPPSALDKVKQVIIARHSFQVAVGRAKAALFASKHKDGGTPDAPSGDKLDTLVRRRAAAFDKEKDLLTWFCMTQAQPTPAPWSSGWDRLLGQALDAMWMQSHSMARIRGSLLWVREANQCAFGAVYFAIIFLDRIVRVISGGGAFLFLPTASHYSAGVSWATVYFIVASGSLEMVLAAMSAREGVVDDMRVGLPGKHAGAGGRSSDKSEAVADVAFVGQEQRMTETDVVMLPDILAVQRKADTRFFRQQLARFVGWILVGMGLANGCMWLFSRNAHQDVWIVFHSATIGYSGILLGAPPPCCVCVPVLSLCARVCL